LHLEIDVAARERIHMVGRCGAKGNKGVHVQFCTRKAGIETICHQADFFKSPQAPDFEKIEYEPIFRIVA